MSSVLEAPQMGAGAGVIEAKVNYNNRKHTYDSFFGVAFVICLLVHIGMCGYLIGNTNVVISEQTIDTGDGTSITLKFRNYTGEAHADLLKCCTDNGINLSPGSLQCMKFKSSNRRLENNTSVPCTDDKSDFCYNGQTISSLSDVNKKRLSAGKSELVNQDAFSFLANQALIPAIIFVVVPLMAVGWLFFLQKFAVTVTWVSVGISVALPIALGIMLRDVDQTIMFLWIGFGAVIALVAGIKNKAITQGGQHLAMAAKALEENWSVFASTSILQLVYLLLLVLSCYAINAISDYGVALYHPDYANYGMLEGCTMVTPDHRNKALGFLFFMMSWMTYFIFSMKVVMTSMSIGSWFFGQADRPANHSVVGMKTALTTSLGTAAFGSLIITLAEEIRKKTQSKLNWLSPLGCVLKIVGCCLLTVLETFGKFALIAHAFTGENLCVSGKNAIGVLKHSMGGAYIQDRVGTTIIKYSSYIFSVAIGFGSWALVDAFYGMSTIGGLDMWGGAAFFWFFFALYFYLTWYPIPTILIMSMLSEFLVGFGETAAAVIYLQPAIVGLISAAIASIIFNFQGSVILCALDTIIFAYAVGKNNNVAHNPAHADMYALLGDYTGNDGLGSVHVAVDVNKPKA